MGDAHRESDARMVRGTTESPCRSDRAATHSRRLSRGHGRRNESSSVRVSLRGTLSVKTSDPGDRSSHRGVAVSSWQLPRYLVLSRRNSAAKMGAATDSALDSDGVGCEAVGSSPQETQSGKSESHKQKTIWCARRTAILGRCWATRQDDYARTSRGEPRRARGPTLAYPEQARCRMGALSTEARVNQARGGKGG